MKVSGRPAQRLRLVILSIGVGEPSETVPLGAACVAAALTAAFAQRLSVALVEASPSEAPRRIASRIASRTGESRPDFVGFSLYSWNRNQARSVAEVLRAKGFEGLLFAGGPEASAETFDVMAELDLDFAVVGEGETSAVAAFGELLGRGAGRDGVAAGLEGLPGIALPGREGAFRRRAAPDPATLVSPWLAGTASSRGRDEAVWELSRGCAFHCTYCYEGRGEGGVRAFSRARVEAELDLLVREGAKRIFVLDPTFNWKRERALELLSLFAERGKAVVWKFEARAELLDRSLARAFARLDASIQIGLQSADPEVLARVGRPGFDPDRFASKVALLDAEGLTWGLDLIYGLPGDTLRGFSKSLDYALGLGPNHLDVFCLAVLPGTELAVRAGEFGLRVNPEAPHLLLEGPGFPAADIARARDLANACDIFYTKGRAVAWFFRALSPLKSRPAAFLGRFAEWMAGRDGASARGGGTATAGAAMRSEAAARSEAMEHRDIEAIQLAFLEKEYGERGLEELWPLLRDIVRFEGAWTRAMADGETAVLELAHGPEALVDPPNADLRALSRLAKPRPMRVRLRPGWSGPSIEMLK